MSTINPTFTDKYRDVVVDLIDGNITATSLNLSGDLDVAGTATANAVRIDEIINDDDTFRWDKGNSDGLASINSIAIGNLAGHITQNSNTVAIGLEAGYQNQGANGVAIGQKAGRLNQQSETVAIGNTAGQTTQGVSCVAIGNAAGNSSQGSNAVAIGRSSGTSSQGSAAVAIGYAAGSTSQGAAAVAIGQTAGQTSQHANSIILNATGSALNSTGTSRFFVKPIRGVAHGIGVGRLVYDSTTGEITYSTS